MQARIPTMRVLKTALSAGAVVAVMAGTSVVAFAYPTPTGHHSIKCSPSHVSANNGSCSVVFTDKDKNDNPRAGQNVCFSVQGPGTVNPTCSTTDPKGAARTTYFAGTVTCPTTGKDPDGPPVNIFGQENPETAGGEVGAAKTKVEIDCPKPPKPPHSDSNASTNQHAAAPLSATSSSGPGAGGIALGVVVLTLIVALAVAVTGRFGLRKLLR
jgi:hypothetical protein